MAFHPLQVISFSRAMDHWIGNSLNHSRFQPLKKSKFKINSVWKARNFLCEPSFAEVEASV